MAAFSIALATVTSAIRYDVGQASFADTRDDIDVVCEGLSYDELKAALFATAHVASAMVVARCEDQGDDPFAYMSEVALGAWALEPDDEGQGEGVT